MVGGMGETSYAANSLLQACMHLISCFLSIMYINLILIRGIVITFVLIYVENITNKGEANY